MAVTCGCGFDCVAVAVAVASTVAGWNNYDAVKVTGSELPPSGMLFHPDGNRLYYLPTPGIRGRSNNAVSLMTENHGRRCTPKNNIRSSDFACDAQIELSTGESFTDDEHFSSKTWANCVTCPTRILVGQSGF